MKRLILTLLFLSASTTFAQQVTEVTGDVVGDFEALKVNVTIVGIPKAEVKTSPTTTDLYNNLAISLPSYTKNTKPILNSANAAKITTTNTNPAFIWEGNSANLTQDKDPNLFKISYTLTIRTNNKYSPTVALGDISKVSIDVQAQFVQLLSNGNYDDPLGNASLGTKKVGTIQDILTSPKDAPVSFDVAEADRGIKVSWDGSVNVKYVPTTDPEIEQEPDQVLIMVFDDAAQNITLKAKNAGKALPYTTNTSCLFNSGSIGGSDCITCSAPGANGTWITEEKPDNAGAVSWELVENNGSYVVPGLTPNKEHTVVIQYQKGVKRTVCKKVTPYETTSLTEANGGEPAKPGDPRCFIVSAAFGSPFNRHVDVFRWARDRFLEPFSLGHSFVEFYYEYSQPFANLVKSSPALQTTVRLFLYPLAFLLYALQECTQYPTLSFSIAALLILFFMGMRRRKLSRVG